MKNLIWAVLILVVAIAVVLEFRYTLVIDSPVVAKIDRLTGEVWIVNAGQWRKIQSAAHEKVQAEIPFPSHAARQAK